MGLDLERLKKQLDEALEKETPETMLQFMNEQRAKINADSVSCQVDTFVKPPPKIICICGSTRFADLHAIARWEFEKDGSAICLMINYLPAGYFEGFGNNHYGEKFGNKEVLDELHFRKIEMANEIYVINKNGYIGESTRNEIEYGKKLGKPIKYLEAD